MSLNNPSNKRVELTKVHYFEDLKKDRNAEIRTISREVFDNDFNRRMIIKSNIFGHKWVLKINESRDDVRKNNSGKNRCRICLYVIVFICIIIAIGFGIFFSFFESFEKHNYTIVTEVPIINVTRINLVLENSQQSINNTQISIIQPILNKQIYTQKLNLDIAIKNGSICNCSKLEDICLKIHDLKPPKCVKRVSNVDPSGCGGLCLIGAQFCKILDRKRNVVQCTNNTNLLKCPERHFNCGNMCIDNIKRCDGFSHCSNNSDEKNCECNLLTHFQCGNRTSCLENSKRCNGSVDCWDISDEKNCHSPCLTNELPCASNNQCILKSKFCDGTSDCLDSSDEPEGCNN